MAFPLVRILHHFFFPSFLSLSAFYYNHKAVSSSPLAGPAVHLDKDSHPFSPDCYFFGAYLNYLSLPAPRNVGELFSREPEVSPFFFPRNLARSPPSERQVEIRLSRLRGTPPKSYPLPSSAAVFSQLGTLKVRPSLESSTQAGHTSPTLNQAKVFAQSCFLNH